MKKVYDASDIIEANIVKGLLEQCGIEAYISGFYLHGGIGEIPVSGTAGLWVADDQEDAARDVIRQYEHNPQLLAELKELRGLVMPGDDALDTP